MTHCHAHAGQHAIADKWTNIATVGELVSSFLSNAYWLGIFFDMCSGLKSAELGLSNGGAVFGVLSALLSASGAAYSHRTLNMMNQNVHEHEHGHAHQEYAAVAQLEEGTPDKPPPSSKSVGLSWPLYLALAGDFISHAGDIAGPLTFVIQLAFISSLPRWGNALGQSGATLFGCLSAVANVRTCRNAMRERNTVEAAAKPCHAHDGQADKWTNIATVGQLVASFVSDAYWLGSLFDMCSGLKSGELGLSIGGAVFGVLSALLSACGKTYSHRTLNMMNQNVHEHGRAHQNCGAVALEDRITPEKPLLGSKSIDLSWPQYLALAGDFISDVGDIAGPLTFVIQLAFKSSLPRWGNALAQSGATLFAGVSAVANVRTCKNAMRERNTVEAAAKLQPS